MPEVEMVFRVKMHVSAFEAANMLLAEKDVEMYTPDGPAAGMVVIKPIRFPSGMEYHIYDLPAGRSVCDMSVDRSVDPEMAVEKAVRIMDRKFESVRG